MTREQIVARIKDVLGARIVQWTDKSARRIYVEIKPEDILEASRLVFRELEARFSIATGVDTPSGIEIMYHWSFDNCGMVVTIRTVLDRNNPVIESIALLCKGAEWIEREMWEMLGITFKNHPDMRHLLLADDWPAGKYPYKRDFIRDGKEWITEKT